MAKAPKADDPNEGVHHASPVEVLRVDEVPEHHLAKCRACGKRRSRWNYTDLPSEGTSWRDKCATCDLLAIANRERKAKGQDAYERAIERRKRQDEERAQEAFAKEERDE